MLIYFSVVLIVSLRQVLMLPQVYSSYELSASYETSRLLRNLQTVKRQMLSW